VHPATGSRCDFFECKYWGKKSKLKLNQHRILCNDFIMNALAYLKNQTSKFHQISTSTVTMAPSSINGNAMLCTCCFADDVVFHIMKQMGSQNQRQHMFHAVCQVVAPVRNKTRLFGRVYHVASPGMKSAISDCNGNGLWSVRNLLQLSPKVSFWDLVQP